MLFVCYFAVSLYLVAMASGNSDSLQATSVKLTGDNFMYCAYVMKNFLLGKNMWRYITNSTKAPSDAKAANYSELLSNWETQNAKIIIWINNSKDPSIGIHLAK